MSIPRLIFWAFVAIILFMVGYAILNFVQGGGWGIYFGVASLLFAFILGPILPTAWKIADGWREAHESKLRG